MAREDDTTDRPEQPTMDSLPSAAPAALTARYEILAELGRGGMGIVYKARDRETGAVVALKVLRPEIAADTQAVERFKSELLLARKITHKNVCRIHELLRFGDTVAISMEYVEGESLRAILQRFTGVPMRSGLEWLGKICAALAEAHSQGVVHRDLKPENILITREGAAKVMDFGIARSLESDLTQTGRLIGTPAYMSPEQAQGKPADPRSDIYSLGLIIYEMFTGRGAFQAETPVALALKQIHETPPPAGEVEPHLPAFLGRAIEKCLEKSPGKRFQSAEELAAALAGQPEVKPSPAEGVEVPLPVHLTRWQRSDWLLLISAVVGLCLYFPFFERVSLAPRSKVSFDRSVLRRIARDYAQRLGAPVEGEGRIETAVFPGMWEYEYLAERTGARAALELCNNPVPYWLWYVVWENGTRVNVDNRGALSTFERGFPAGVTSEKPSLEARPLFEKALRDHFGREASEMVLETATAGTWKGYPAVSITWADRNDYYGIKRRYLVRLAGREIAALDRRYDLPDGYVGRDFGAAWQVLPLLALHLILLVLGFCQRHLVDLGARWRVAIVLLITVAGMWYQWQLMYAGGPPQPIAVVISVSVLAGLVFVPLTFFACIAAERSVRRMAPAKLVSLVRLFTSAAVSEPCGLAIVRGTCVGLALLGAETFLAWLGTSHLRIWLDGLQHVGLQAHWFLSSPWSSANVLHAIWQAAEIALLIAFFISLMTRLARRSWLALPVAVVLSVLMVPGSIFFSISMGAVQPYHWKALLLLFDFLVLAWTFTRFDVLTLAWAVFTFAFCWENYHLLVMLAPAGVLEPWVAFAVFGLLVLGAAAVAFQANLRAARRRLAAAFE